MDKDIDWTLLARYLSGECPEEKANVEKWIESDPENESLFLMLKMTWETKESQPSIADMDKLWLNFRKRTGIRSTSDLKIAERDAQFDGGLLKLRSRQFPLLRNAAVLIIAIGLSILVGKLTGFLPFKAEPDLISVTVERGRQLDLKLADGTTVSLDAGSTFKYPSGIESGKREVYLEGEAYFDVAHDGNKPFIVESRNAKISVLGTKFNIRGWGDVAGSVQVVVEEGSVSLKSTEGENGDSVVIGKGQLSTLDAGRVPTEPRSVEVSRYLGWMHNEIFFEDARLSEVLGQLERWYDIEFILPDSSIGSERLSLHIEKKSLDDILDLLSALTGLSCSRHGKVIQFQN